MHSVAKCAVCQLPPPNMCTYGFMWCGTGSVALPSLRERNRPSGPSISSIPEATAPSSPLFSQFLCSLTHYTIMTALSQGHLPLEKKQFCITLNNLWLRMHYDKCHRRRPTGFKKLFSILTSKQSILANFLKKNCSFDHNYKKQIKWDWIIRASQMIQFCLSYLVLFAF